MKTAIIHLSDLHITEHLNENQVVISSTWIKKDDTTFITDLINTIKKVKNKKKINRFLLVVSGDLSNTSSEEEYKSTKVFLEDFTSKLEIKKEDVLIVPGNHDLNWHENRKAFYEYKKQKPKEHKMPYLFYIEKYKYFTKFYNAFFSKQRFKFCTEKYIIRHLIVDDILLIGLNSTLNSSFTEEKEKSEAVFITAKLQAELEHLKTLVLNYDNFAKIAVFHHNPLIIGRDDIDISIKEWDSVRQTFKNNDISVFMFGHEHVAGVEKDIENTFIATSGVAIKPIKKKSIENNINIIEIINKKNEITLIPNFFHLKEEKRNKYSPEYGFWNPVESESLSKELPILKKGKSPNKSLSLVPPQVDLHEDKNNSNQKQDNKVKSKKRDYSSELFEAVKKKNIFISGHFHWSDEAKAHNWLIIPKLLEDKEIGALCKKALIDLFLQKIKKTDLIIGIGMEGSFLASNISAKMDIPFSFIPYQFRHKDHDTPELEINHAPVDNLTIIIDVINSGSTIIEMLKKNNNKKFFSKPKKINLLSLFHTGEKSKPSVDLLKKTVDKRIDYYYVCDRFRIHQCPYSKDKNFKKNCVICDEKLEPIYEFYSQNSNISE